VKRFDADGDDAEIGKRAIKRFVGVLNKTNRKV
jgi:hypothetical protein